MKYNPPLPSLWPTSLPLAHISSPLPWNLLCAIVCVGWMDGIWMEMKNLFLEVH
jgi:hypothetical protein